MAAAAADDRRLAEAQVRISALAEWITHAFQGKVSEGTKGKFSTLYYPDALTTSYNEGTITVEGAGYSFVVQKEESNKRILIRNGNIRVNQYRGTLPTASTKATLSLRVLLADMLCKMMDPPLTVICKLDDRAVMTARPNETGKGSGSTLTRPVLFWSTLSYILHGKSFYTYLSDGAFQLHSSDADSITVEQAIVDRAGAIRSTLSDGQSELLNKLFKNPSKPTWDLVRQDGGLIRTLTGFNASLYGKTAIGVTYDYTAGSDHTSIHTYFAGGNHREGCWNHPPCQLKL